MSGGLRFIVTKGTRGLVLLLAAAGMIHASVACRDEQPRRAGAVPTTKPLEQRLSDEFNYDDPASTEARFAALAHEAEHAGDVSAAAEILTQVARAQGLQGHLEAARSTLTRAASLRTASTRPRVRALIETGRLLRRERRLAEAQDSFEQAYQLALTNEQAALAADAAHMLALLLPFDQAAIWTDRGLCLAEASPDPYVRRWVGVIAYNWGGRLAERGEHSEAALSFARSLAARQRENDVELIATTEFALAVELRKLNHAAQALAIDDRLLRDAIVAKRPVGEIWTERAENLSALGRAGEARRAAENALRFLPADQTPAEQIARLRALSTGGS